MNIEQALMLIEAIPERIWDQLSPSENAAIELIIKKAKLQNGISLMEEIAKLQMDYNNLKLNNKLSKKAICDLVIPFRDKYYLSDKDALAIARNEMSIIDMVDAIKTNFYEV